MKNKLFAEYAPYDQYPAFYHGHNAYITCSVVNPYVPDSTDARAYDRGVDYARSLARQRPASV